VMTAMVATAGKTGLDMTAKCGDISNEPRNEHPLDLAHHIRSMHPQISHVPEDDRLGQNPAWYYHSPPTSVCLLQCAPNKGDFGTVSVTTLEHVADTSTGPPTGINGKVTHSPTCTCPTPCPLVPTGGAP